MKPSAELVLSMLRDGPKCLWDFEVEHVGRFGARIHELRHDHGFRIDSTKCVRHGHRNYIEQYELISVPVQQTLEVAV